MKIGLVSFQCRNGDPAFNMSQVERALKESQGRIDLLCFGEAFLQGFDSLTWDYETDKETALSQDSGPIARLKDWSVQYSTALLTGYIEKSDDRLFSSCIVIAEGQILYNYRRISKGWKEYSKTDEHYCEGNAVEGFRFHGKDFMLGLCGDLWDHPEKFRTESPLIWPIYVNYSLEDWEQEILADYASHASKIARDVFMVDPLDADPVNHGGAFHFRNGQIVDRLPFDREGILIVEI